jgi:hypothetical protein
MGRARVSEERDPICGVGKVFLDAEEPSKGLATAGW